MSFEPLAYLWSTLTVWHMVVLFVVVALIGIVVPMRGDRPVMWSWIPFGLASLASSYSLLVLLLGQIFGDKFSLSALWPSTFILTLAFMALPIVNPTFLRGREERISFGTACIAVLIGAPFFAFGLWILPRVVGFGLVEIPRLSWGVAI